MKVLRYDADQQKHSDPEIIQIYHIITMHSGCKDVALLFIELRSLTKTTNNKGVKIRNNEREVCGLEKKDKNRDSRMLDIAPTLYS